MIGTVYALAAALNFCADHDLADVSERVLAQVPLKSMARSYLKDNAGAIVKPFWRFDEDVVEEVKTTILLPITLAAALLYFGEHKKEVESQDIVGDNGTENQLFRYLGIKAEIHIHHVMGCFLDGPERDKAIAALKKLDSSIPKEELKGADPGEVRRILDKTARTIEGMR